MTKKLPLKTDITQSHNAITQHGYLNLNFFWSRQKNQTKNKGEKNDWGKNIIIYLLFPMIVAIGPLVFSKVVNGSPKKIVQGLQVSPLSTIAPAPSPTPVNICNAPDFVESDWNLSSYRKDTDDYYIPKATSKKGFWYPPITYKGNISAVFKEIDIDYQATYQNEESTSSATLFIGIYDDHNDEILEVLAPEPNRQLVGFKKLGTFSDNNTPITPVQLNPFTLGKQVAYTGTHSITISSQRTSQNDQVVVYTVSGVFIDSHGVKQTMYEVVPVELPTANPSLKQFHFVIGTEIGGKLKIEKADICD